MARRRKGRGGRVTPKGTRPLNWGSPTAVTPLLPPGLDELLPRFEDDLAVFRDSEASAFVSMFRTGLEQPSPFDPPDPDDIPPTFHEVLTVLGDLGPFAAPRVVDTVAAFAVYGEVATDQARRVLGTFNRKPSAAATCFGEATITSTLVAEDIFGESEQYIFELAYPDRSVGALAVMIDRLMGGIVKDTIAMPDATTFTDLVDEVDDVFSQPCDPGRAAAAIDEAYSLNDMTIGIDEIIEDEARANRPMVERVLAPITRQPIDFEPLDHDERRRIVADFGEWANHNHPTVDDEVLGWTSLAVDFAADYGVGDPLKWAPNSVAAFLEWSTRKVMASPDELATIPDMLELFVRWTHEQLGWGPELLDRCLSAVADVRPVFEETIADPTPRSVGQEALADLLGDIDLNDPTAVSAALALLDPGTGAGTIEPVGGSHPEPLELSTLGPAAERASTIADVASASSRAIFDDEFVTLVRRLITDVAHADPTLFARGRPDIWAGGVVYAVAQLNGIIGGWNPLAMYADELTAKLAGAPGTITQKAAKIRGVLGEELWSSNPRYQHSRTLFGFGAPGAGPVDDYQAPPPVIAYDRLPAGSAFRIRCELAHLPVWRTVRIPASATLYDLHFLIQRIFDWDDYHLHRFTVAGVGYTRSPDPDWALPGEEDRDDITIRLDELLRPGAVIGYVYDFGDNWEMLIKVEEQLDPDSGPHPLDLIDGAGDAPPEDCGGSWGYRNLIEALSDPNHPEHDDLRAWAGDFRPGSFDLNIARAKLGGA
ncbi:MAG: plasmid pRiA4b ORF-3 family protein [Actinomycetia bacterium]|nr:plasmid pRiA4b ORF-3 family protein [Actinomycetes bacterium]